MLAVLQELHEHLQAEADPVPPSWVDPAITSETFDPAVYRKGFHLPTSHARRAATRRDPLLFALCYLKRHLKSEATGGRITFADAHLDWCRRALEWVEPAPERPDRQAEIAPRETGKSTWWFLIFPLWAAAHGHARFIAAFADSTGQAETHLLTFKRELERNATLREDFPDLCAPARRQSGHAVADRSGMIHQANGFTFAARGIDSASLGLKVEEKRPDVILLDDVEKDESNYSALQADKRLRTIIDAILPMNLRARVVLSGTVTMAGSIVHQLARAAAGDPLDDTTRWIEEERWETHHARPIITCDDGTERSIWPAKWPLELLESMRGTRSYRKNFENDPLGGAGGYWTVDDFIHGTPEGETVQFLSIDPAVTTKTTSDYTGLAVIGYIPARVVLDPATGRRRLTQSMAVVHDAREVRLVGEYLRAYVLRLLSQYQSIRLIVVESNQGGENWRSILHDMPVKIALPHNHIKKEVRAANCLHFYHRKRVYHGDPKRTRRLEEQMVSFPKAPHDDMVDAVTTVLNRLLTAPPQPTTSMFPG